MATQKKTGDSYDIITIVAMYFLLEYGYIKLLFDNVLIEYLQYIFLAIVIAIWMYKLARTTKIRFDSISGMIVVFSLWVAITKLYSISMVYSDLKMINYCISVVFLFLARSFIEDANNNSIGNLLVFLTKCNFIVIGLFSILNFNDFLGAAGQGQRIGSESQNPIWIARLCCETILSMIVLPKELKNKKICFFAISALLALVFFTGSKGPLVALALAWFYYIYISSPHHSKRISLKFIGQISIFFVLVAFGLSMVDYFKDLDFVKYRFSWEAIFVDAEGYRMERYSFAWEKIQENLVLGYGIGSWPILYNGIDKMDYPHNIILELWLETGAIGLFLFCIIIRFALKGVSGANDRVKIISAFFVMSIVMAMFSGSLTEGNRGLYTYLGIMSAIKFVHKKKDILAVETK